SAQSGCTANAKPLGSSAGWARKGYCVLGVPIPPGAMADPIDNQNDRNVGLVSRQQEQKMQQHQQNHRNERRRRMQKMQEIFLPGRLWEWRALTTTLPYSAGAQAVGVAGGGGGGRGRGRGGARERGMEAGRRTKEERKKRPSRHPGGPTVRHEKCGALG